MRRIGILTGGGDAPGLNAVIRAAAKVLFKHGVELIGFIDGYSGLVEKKYRVLDRWAISGLLHRGGTILGTNNRDNPFNYPVKENGKTVFKDMSDTAVKNLNDLNIESLIAIGGDGSLAIARELWEKGAKVIGVPKTIDNDLMGTEQTFGFDTAVTTATEALDKLHTTAESHHRVMVLELMGRYAGWIALYSGLAGGADVILIPEIPWKLENVVKKINQRKEEGKPFSIIVVAEGVKTPEGELVVKQRIDESGDPLRLGGIGQKVAKMVEDATGFETRVTVLGHLQRGGSPSPFDRILATRYGVAAAELALKGEYGVMVSLINGKIQKTSLAGLKTTTRNVPTDSEVIYAARKTGISFGD
ncbi:MAG: ATP-dependent phosphofructokinase / diphosphate-dependent phosphofructokinase [Thermosediminibacterales bacterium]|nr:ATP-dependent phosphofructokinase / diphosphate-dependent phosphofructokinase [Thermosediminibacterales bacterium]MDK2836520.1 ATP-dependent phosphofructokinase / diphosphate-dependent phosphofructokinase [Thermosediminibacterales bacterium]